MRGIDDEAGKNDWVRAIIDVPGVGGGVVDRLAELDLPVTRFNGGEAPIDEERFVNARAEDYWTLRERFEQGEIDIAPMTTSSPPSSARSSGGIGSRGRIKIESKDDMRKRGLPSRIGLMRWRSPSRAKEMLHRSMSRVTPAKALRGI